MEVRGGYIGSTTIIEDWDMEGYYTGLLKCVAVGADRNKLWFEEKVDLVSSYGPIEGVNGDEG